jgi:hypothetical protein
LQGAAYSTIATFSFARMIFVPALSQLDYQCVGSNLRLPDEIALAQTKGSIAAPSEK